MRKILPQVSSAFTLIELLVVMAILGILATIAIGSFRTSQMRSRDAQRKSDLKQIATGLELYYNDHGLYPSASGGLIVGCPSTPSPANCVWGLGEFTDGKTTFIMTMPEDPGGDDYCYWTNLEKTAYRVYAHLENPKDQNCINGICATAISCGSGDSYNFVVTSTNIKPTD